MQTFLLLIHVLLSISLIALILLQQGKGADAGAAFGSGASGTVFGSKGSASFLSRATAILATLFFAVSLALAIVAHRQADYATDTDKYALPDTATEQAAEAAAVEPSSDVPVVPQADEAQDMQQGGDMPVAPETMEQVQPESEPGKP